jgi:hypothetical protein
MPKFCPKCDARAYDDTSFFCYRCGADLQHCIQEKVCIPEKKNMRSLSYSIIAPEKEFTSILDDSHVSLKPVSDRPIKVESIPEREDDEGFLKPVSIESIKPGSIPKRGDSEFLPKPSAINPAYPVEICAKCGDQIINKNRIFCPNCGSYIREELSGDISSIVKHPVIDPFIKIPNRDQNPIVGTRKDHVPTVIQITGVPLNPKADERRSIFILAGIAIIFFILFAVLLLMFP